MALEYLGLGPAEVLHVGDSLESDVAGANAVGIDAGWVTQQEHRAPDWARVRCNVDDLREALPLLQAE